MNSFSFNALDNKYPVFNALGGTGHGENLSNKNLFVSDVLEKIEPSTLVGASISTIKSKERTIHKVGKSEKGAKARRKRTCRKSASDKPKRPLSAYNLFFRSERERILQKLNSTNGEPEDYEHGSLNTQDGTLQETSVESIKGCSNSRKKGIGFANLARTVAEQWKILDGSSRANYERQAIAEKTRYKTELVEWKNAQETKKAVTEIQEFSPCIPRTQLMQERLQDMLLPSSQTQEHSEQNQSHGEGFPGTMAQAHQHETMSETRFTVSSSSVSYIACDEVKCTSNHNECAENNLSFDNTDTAGGAQPVAAAVTFAQMLHDQIHLSTPACHITDHAHNEKRARTNHTLQELQMQPCNFHKTTKPVTSFDSLRETLSSSCITAEASLAGHKWPSLSGFISPTAVPCDNQAWPDFEPKNSSHINVNNFPKGRKGSLPSAGGLCANIEGTLAAAAAAPDSAVCPFPSDPARLLEVPHHEVGLKMAKQSLQTDIQSNQSSIQSILASLEDVDNQMDDEAVLHMSMFCKQS